MMVGKSGRREAPPTKNPSMSGCEPSSFAFPALTEPAHTGQRDRQEGPVSPQESHGKGIGLPAASPLAPLPP
jgi:hypothetical protein